MKSFSKASISENFERLNRVKNILTETNIDTGVLNMKIGDVKDWKFGLITREVERIGEDEWVINDTSSGWQQALVDSETLKKLLSGKLSLLDLDWE